MSRENADWTLSPALETRTAASARALPYKKRAKRLFFISVLALFFSCGFGFSDLDGAVEIAYSVAFFAFVAGIYYARDGRKREIVLRQRERELLVEYASLHGWLIDLFVLQGDTPTGRDRGVVWFEEDRLYFVGDRTSFGISRGQVAAMLSDEWRATELRPEFVLKLNADTPVGKAAIGIDMILPMGSSVPFPSSKGLGQALRGWIRSSGGEEGQLPPLMLGPQIPSRGRLFVRAIGFTAIWVSVVLGAALAGFVAGWARRLWRQQRHRFFL